MRWRDNKLVCPKINAMVRTLYLGIDASLDSKNIGFSAIDKLLHQGQSTEFTRAGPQINNANDRNAASFTCSMSGWGNRKAT